MRILYSLSRAMCAISFVHEYCVIRSRKKCATICQAHPATVENCRKFRDSARHVSRIFREKSPHTCNARIEPHLVRERNVYLLISTIANEVLVAGVCFSRPLFGLQSSVDGHLRAPPSENDERLQAATKREIRTSNENRFRVPCRYRAPCRYSPRPRDTGNL